MAKLIAEVGINHNGNFFEGKKLIDMASLTNCWGVKFQYRNLRNYFLNSTKSSELGKEVIDTELLKNYLNHTQILRLAKYAKNKRLRVGISLFSKKDYFFFSRFKFDFLKIPSPVSHDYELINFLKNKSKNLIISFGGKDYSDIKKIIYDCKLKAKKTTLLHCISNYPLNEINSNLGFLDKLKKDFKTFKIGYSSHEKTIINSILCLSKNIDFIERHITLNKKHDGLDHASSSDFDEFELFKIYNENFFNIFKLSKKFSPNQGEVINIQNLGSSYYSTKSFKKGEYVKKKHLIKKQPCIGLTDVNIKEYLNKKLTKDIKKNHPITKSVFINHNLIKSNLNKLNKFNFSLPVRPHDYKKIQKEIPIKNFEMHLSFNDIKHFNINDFEKSFIKKNQFSIHMPDYCDENAIIDFFSPTPKIKIKSKNILFKTIKIANQIKKINGFPVDIIVSLSGLDNKGDRFSLLRGLTLFLLEYQ